MDKKLFLTRKDIYSKSPAIFWAVSSFTMIFAIALAALEAVIPGLYIVTYPIIFFPLLFSSLMTLLTIKFGGTITFKSTWSIATAYFKRSNFGCFNIIKNFFKAILVGIVVSFIMLFVLNRVFTYFYGNLFIDNMQKALDLYSSQNTDAFNAFMSEDNVFKFYVEALSNSSISGTIIAFVYFVAYGSPKVYLCANLPGGTAAFSNVVFKRFLRTKRSSYRKDFWSLNWPLLTLLTLGIVGGYLLVILLDIDFSYSLAISSMIGLTCLIPFAPFFFAGTEALFAKYNEDMRKASMELTQGFLKNLRDNANITEEDKAKIDELLSKENKSEQSDDNNSQS